MYICYMRFISLLLLLCIVTSCAESGKNEKPLIVTTTGMLGDVVKNLAGSFADVTPLMGPGVDPHLYKASQGDMQLLSRADMIVYNGLALEGKMSEALTNIGKQKRVLAAGDQLDSSLLLSAGHGEAVDPHIWFDVNIWKQVTQIVAQALAEEFPTEAEQIGKNAAIYQDSLDALQRFVVERISGLSPEKRVLITSHDAFRYFGKAYGIEVIGLQGISTVSEYGLQDVSRMVEMITRRKIPAVFVESSVSEKSLMAVVEGCAARGHKVAIGGSLFSDAMGAEGQPEGTYSGMIRYNVNTITSALK